MKYTVLGQTGVLVSELCFGTMSFGNEADENESARMFARCRDAGINFYDCANNYSDGRAEVILGRLINDCRDEIVITTKVTHRTGKDVNAIGSSRRHIMIEIEKSLQRLGTDRIDLYFIHQFDELTPIDETLRVLDDLIRQGKVLYIGASNWAAWQVAKALGISAKEGLARFECIEPMYNLVKRQAEVELFPLVLSENVGAIVYNPLAAGLLSGKFSGGKSRKTGRIVERDLYAKRYSDPAYYDIAERFYNCAMGKNINPVTLAVSWVKAHPAVTAPIIGARNMEQLSASLAAADLDLTAEMRQEISNLSIHPANATDRLEENLDAGFQLRSRR
ncbi:MAG: aldo/keto reductase [Desulfobacterales bacterium]|jgi:aryl-alcohol dehydrogenase-like predicted oxidoreductase